MGLTHGQPAIKALTLMATWQPQPYLKTQGNLWQHPAVLERLRHDQGQDPGDNLQMGVWVSM